MIFRVSFPRSVMRMLMKVIYSVNGDVMIQSVFSKGIEGTISWNDTIPYTVLTYVMGNFISYFSDCFGLSFFWKIVEVSCLRLKKRWMII